MKVYRSKNKINTSEQFILTLDIDLPKYFTFGFILDNKEITPDKLQSICKIRKYQSKATIIFDNTNNILKDDNYSSKIDQKNIIKYKKELKEKEVFNFFNDECVLVNNIIYEKIYSLTSEDIDVYEQDGVAFSNRGKYDVLSPNDKKFATIDTDKYPIIALFSYLDGSLDTKKYVNTLDANKLKLTISNTGEINAYFEKNGKTIEKLSYTYSFPEDNYLYIFSDQNILSNAAVSGVESSDTSANIA